MSRRSALVKPLWIALLLAGAVVAWMAFRKEEPAPARARPASLPPVSETPARRSAPSTTPSTAQEPALTAFERRIADASRRLGKEHPFTLSLRSKQALWLNGQGRHAEAEEEVGEDELVAAA